MASNLPLSHQRLPVPTGDSSSEERPNCKSLIAMNERVLFDAALEIADLKKRQAFIEKACEGALEKALNELKLESDTAGLVRMFSLRHEFPTEWHRFIHPQTDYVGDQILTMALEKDRYSFLFMDMTITVLEFELFVKIKEDFVDSYTDSTLKLSLKAGTAASMSPLDLVEWNDLLRGKMSPAGSLGNWTLTAWLDGTPHQRLDQNAIQDIFLVNRYTVTSA